jgi:hypothetical protein
MSADIDKRFEEVEAAREAARKAQEDIDKLALLDLLEQHDGDVQSVKLKSYRKGLPTFAVVRAPKRTETKRFQDIASKDKSRATEALAQLGVCCVVYPSRDIFEKILERAPAFDVSCGNAALDLALGKAKSEGKD